MSQQGDLSIDLDFGKLNIRVAALIMRGDKILLELGYNSEFYVLPGGRVRFGETAEDAVVREIREELGVEIKPIRCLYVHQNFFPWNGDIDCHEIGFYFLAEAPDKLSDQSAFPNMDGKSSFHWVTVEQFKAMEVYPLCVHQNIDNLPQHTQLITERYAVDDEGESRKFRLV